MIFLYIFNKLFKFLEKNKIGNKFAPLFSVKNLIPVIESLLIKMVEIRIKISRYFEMI